MAGKQVGMQFDNCYRTRYCSDPVRRDCCLNVTAMSLLQQLRLLCNRVSLHLTILSKASRKQHKP